MEESKLLALHESLSKLRKSAGLGVASQYSWQKKATTTSDENNLTRTADGKLIRKDGLPVNSLYNNFVKEGVYDPTKGMDDGDGRTIKRDFSDCAAMVSDTTSDDDDNNSQVRRRKRKEQRKAEKKAAKKAAKLEAKRLAKLEEKRKAKKEAKELKRGLEARENPAVNEEPPRKKRKKDKNKKSKN